MNDELDAARARELDRATAHLSRAPLPESTVRERYDALVAVVAEVADELDARGVEDLAGRLRGAV